MNPEHRPPAPEPEALLPPQPRPDTAAAPTEASSDIERPQDSSPSPKAPAGDGGQSLSRRPWSARRVPAALTALVLLIIAGGLLFEVIWARTGHQAAAWLSTLADELASRPLDDVWMLTGAATAAALGLWLIFSALTPGLRRRLPLRVPADHGRIRAVLDRDSAASLLRDATMRVPGVSRARVRVRRHRIRVRADIRYREPQTVKDEVITAVQHEQHDRLTLAHPQRLAVLVRQRST